MQSIEPLSRQQVLSAWREFLPHVAAYAGARNHVQPEHQNVSRLGAGLRFRTLLEDEVIEDTLKQFSFEAAQKWLQEVCWRRYWKGWMERHSQVWVRWRRQVGLLRQTLPAKILARAEAVSSAGSGVACMDEISGELLRTGYLHNHARMWWASFWIHVEQLPWELGADFFFRHLLDADPASNTLSWRWVAGLQTPGKSYLVRLSNIEKYGPGYLLGRRAGSERLADGVVKAGETQPGAALEAKRPTEYPNFLSQPTGRLGLWLHADDLLPEHGVLAGLSPASVAGAFSGHVYRKNYRLSQRRVESLDTVIRDGLGRAAGHFGCQPVALEAEDPVEGLCTWAKTHALSEVVAFAPFVGPIHDMLPRLRQQLEAERIRLSLIRRASDEVAFSFATAGFFPFWQKMSSHLKLSGAR
jgi:deoxyribodipyrimidine photo-lyase